MYATTWLFRRDNEKVEQLAGNRLTIPQDAIASLLQRLVRHANISTVFLRIYCINGFSELPGIVGHTLIQAGSPARTQRHMPNTP
jgi:hypothetical protein